MDLRDYLRLLKRGWRLIAAVTVLALGIAFLYAFAAPRQYETTTALLVTANDPRSIGDVQRGADFSARSAATFAGIVDSVTVLGPVAAALRPQPAVDDLLAEVSTTTHSSLPLIDVTVTGPDPVRLKVIADAVAAAASRVIPTLETGPRGPLVRLQQIRAAAEPVDHGPGAITVLALGLTVGIVTGTGLTVARWSLDERISDADDLRACTGVLPLAVFPHGVAGLVLRDDPAGAAGDAFGTLRTNLRIVEPRDRRSLAVAAVAGVGGAQLPANLAWSLASAGSSVVLVDVNLRRPTVGELLGVQAGPGIAEVLEGRAGLPAVVRRTSHPGLQVVLAGTTRNIPSDVLSGPGLADVVRRLERRHDYVVLHVPPLLTCTDAAVVSSVAASTFVSVVAGRDRVGDLTRALNSLAAVRVEPLGMVLVAADLRTIRRDA